MHVLTVVSVPTIASLIVFTDNPVRVVIQKVINYFVIVIKVFHIELVGFSLRRIHSIELIHA